MENFYFVIKHLQLPVMDLSIMPVMEINFHGGMKTEILKVPAIYRHDMVHACVCVGVCACVCVCVCMYASERMCVWVYVCMPMCLCMHNGIKCVRACIILLRCQGYTYLEHNSHSFCLRLERKYLQYRI